MHDLTLLNGHKYRVSIAGEGIPLLYSPGYTATAPVYFQTLNRLVKLIPQGFKVIILDAPGHGGTSPLPRLDSLNGMAYGRFTADVIEHLGLNSVVLMGHSFGGLRSFACAAQVPERVLGIFDLDAISSAKWDRWVHSLRRQPQRMPAFFLDFLRDGVDTIPWGEYRSGQLQRMGWSAGWAYLRNLGKAFHLAAPGLSIMRYAGNGQARQIVRQAGIPVAVLHGDRDRIVHPDSGLEAAEQSGGQLVSIKGGSHTWMVKCPDTLAAVVRLVWDGPFGSGLRDLDPAGCYQSDSLALSLELDPDRSHRRPPGDPHFEWQVTSYA